MQTNSLLRKQTQSSIIFYVDDCLKSMPTELDAMELISNPLKSVTEEASIVGKVHFLHELLQSSVQKF